MSPDESPCGLGGSSAFIPQDRPLSHNEKSRYDRPLSALRSSAFALDPLFSPKDRLLWPWRIACFRPYSLHPKSHQSFRVNYDRLFPVDDRIISGLWWLRISLYDRILSGWWSYEAVKRQRPLYHHASHFTSSQKTIYFQLYRFCFQSTFFQYSVYLSNVINICFQNKIMFPNGNVSNVCFQYTLSRISVWYGPYRMGLGES